MFSNKDNFILSYRNKIASLYAKTIEDASNAEKYFALGFLIRDYINANWVNTNRTYEKEKIKQVYYFSVEFLIGRTLETNMINLGIKELCVKGLEDLNIAFEDLEKIEKDPGVGNGGLGRLAVCFLESLASLSMPGHGYGIRYKYGFFEQKFVNGYQVELPDYWLKEGNVWEIKRSDSTVEVKFGGKLHEKTENGVLKYSYSDYISVKAVPFDMPVIGYDNTTVNTLRLWSAEPFDCGFNFQCFNKGEFLKAIEPSYAAEYISEILYPDDSNRGGRVLRLKQEYFMVSSGIQSIVGNFVKMGGEIEKLHEYIAIHINDTHPALAVPELMRVLMDEHELSWDLAFNITTKTISYTNHTIMSESLEKWPSETVRALLPRIYLIIHELNERFCKDIFNSYGDLNLVSKMAIEEAGYIKMAHLVIVGSHSVNGVAKLHTEILKNKELALFYKIYPEKFNNKTNGITHRRWLLKANPLLSGAISEVIGDGWIKSPQKLIDLLPFSEDVEFGKRIAQIKQQNKLRLIEYINTSNGIKIDPESIFDAQVKRMHAYKRQLLNVLNIMDLYNRLVENPDLDILPRTFIFGAKAAPSYALAKSVIKLINSLAVIINNDKRIREKIKIVFLENYNVSLAELIIPSVNVSQQISTASKEASGTGNMKLMMNGAITVATLDGANIEIFEEVGEDNIIIFGMTGSEVLELNENKKYRSLDIYNSDKRIKKILGQLINGFIPNGHNDFMMIYNSLTIDNDEYFLLKDFSSYVEAQNKVDRIYRDKILWNKMSITNIAHSGEFSSDRTILQYCNDIWDIKKCIPKR